MLKERYVSYYITNIFFDAVTAMVSLYLAYFLRVISVDVARFMNLSVSVPPIHSFSELAWLLFIIIPLWPILMDINGAYSTIKMVDLRQTIWIISKSVAQATGILILFMYMFKIEGISRLFIFLISMVSFALLILKELLFRLYFFKRKRSSFAFQNILVLYTGPECDELISTFSNYLFWGLRVFGLITTTGAHRIGQCIHGVPVIGSLDTLSDVLVKHPIDEVVLPNRPFDITKTQQILEECEELGIKTRIPLNYYHLKIAQPSVETFHDMPILTFTTTSTNVLDLFFKYLLDRIMAVFLIIIALPLIAVIALIVKCTSRGPIFFKQTRSGLYGRPFTFYKFRSMYQDAEDRLKDLADFNEMEGPVFKMTNDPRITPIGRFLRKTSLDELPQLFNVLKGEMSLVGPRPPLPKEVEQYQRWQRRKLSMKPGITCIWQISGRNQITDFDEWMRMDLWYIDHWSLWLDVVILAKTIPVVLTMHGAK